jgi:hypothetical protein
MTKQSCYFHYIQPFRIMAMTDGIMTEPSCSPYYPLKDRLKVFSAMNDIIYVLYVFYYAILIDTIFVFNISLYIIVCLHI